MNLKRQWLWDWLVFCFPGCLLCRFRRMGIMAASPDAAMIMNICARSVPWTAVQGSAGMSMTAVLTVVMIMWTVIVTEPVMRSESVRLVRLYGERASCP